MKHLINICLSMAVASMLQGCVMDDLKECPNEYELKVIFDRNMLYVDAFSSQVKSVDIKVFDTKTGEMVYNHEESGSQLATDDYRVKLPIDPGTYNIICWAGMAEGNAFGYATPTAEKLEHQTVVLSTDNGTSKTLLNNLFHGLTTNHTFVDNNKTGSRETQRATVYLTKNTNRLHILLHNLNGKELDDQDFSFYIYSKNGEMSYENSVDAKKAVTYRPWHIQPIVHETDDDSRATVQSALAAEFSVGRLMSKADSRLEVYRESDGERIISVPLERNLLLYKGQFHSSMGDQEYLDRRDDFTMTFILDNNNNWDKAAMIYIEDWATLPIQYQEW